MNRGIQSLSRCLIGVGLVVSALTLGACGSGDDQADEASQPEPAGSAPAPSVEETEAITEPADMAAGDNLSVEQVESAFAAADVEGLKVAPKSEVDKAIQQSGKLIGALDAADIQPEVCKELATEVAEAYSPAKGVVLAKGELGTVAAYVRENSLQADTIIGVTVAQVNSCANYTYEGLATKLEPVDVEVPEADESSGIATTVNDVTTVQKYAKVQNVVITIVGTDDQATTDALNDLAAAVRDESLGVTAE